MILKINSARFGGILRAASTQIEVDIETARRAEMPAFAADFEKSLKACSKMIEEIDGWDGQVSISDQLDTPTKRFRDDDTEIIDFDKD